jgi:peptidyl-tRNA hydrolase, PTH1 family
MYLIVGLGNPGTKYDKTRHNVGFLVVDNFAKRISPSPFQLNKTANAFVLDSTWNQERLILAKPQTYMNNSGNAVKALSRKYPIKDWVLDPQNTVRFGEKHHQDFRGIFVNPFSKKKTKNSHSAWQSERGSRYLIVIQDDLDLLLGKIKISLGSSAGGHKGIESIITSLKTKEFARIRIGIQPADGKPNNVEDFVIQKFTPEEKLIIDSAILNAQHALEMIITDGIQKAMNEYN